MKLQTCFSVALLLLFASCEAQKDRELSAVKNSIDSVPELILPGAYSFNDVLESIDSRRVGVVANHTSILEKTHLVDSLISAGVEVIKVFAPEHGFRGDVPDGLNIQNSVDTKTGVPVVSLYGNSKKATPAMLADIDLVIFDIQDVGVRFYTYLSTLHYVMEAAAESGIPVLVLDRPNPNGFYIDGPVLDLEYSSFIGLHPVPVVTGMTIGEYARMINGESWLANGIKCDLSVIPCENYNHNLKYQLPVSPSPNLPDMHSIYWYPSLCFFEGTNVSVGRGTNSPFTIIGTPENKGGDFIFTPVSIPGASMNPKHKGVECRGYNLKDSLDLNNLPDSLNLAWLVRMYSENPDKESFFRKDGYFELLTGTRAIREALVEGIPFDTVRARWEDDLNSFKKIRSKYLIYP